MRELSLATLVESEVLLPLMADLMEAIEDTEKGESSDLKGEGIEELG